MERVYSDKASLRCYRDALIERALLLERLGRSKEAICLYEDSLRHTPCLEFYVNLGALYISIGRADMAIGPLQTALALAPDCVTGILNLGTAKISLGQFAAALECYQKAVEIEPRNVESLKRLVALLDKVGKVRQAIQAIEQTPAEWRTDDLWLQFGNLLFRTGRKDEACDAFRRAIALREDNAEAHFNLAVVCHELRETAEAQWNFARAAELRPDKRLWLLRAEISGPVVFENAEEIEEHCQRTEQRLLESPAAAQTNFTFSDVTEAGVIPGLTPSSLRRNPRRLRERFAAFYGPCFRDHPLPCGSGNRQRPRVGFLVTRRHDRMFLQSMRGIIEKLDGRRFELVILCSRTNAEKLRTEIRREGLRFVPFGDSLPEAIQQVREAACDLLYYWEIGSDTTNYFLPFARLAPVQCTGWGFTVTCGIPAVDWFLSSELVEHLGSESQYTERLWRSRTLFRYQDRLRPRPPARCADFGLPDNRHLYMCFQNPLKLHPDFDSIMAGILAADPDALIVLMRDRTGQVARMLEGRFSRRVPNASERIVFLSPQPFDEYCRLLCLADAVLDPLHFGANSSCYDIFSFNLPMVTLPTNLMAGRMTPGFYRKMQFEELIASSPADYVSKAVRVANDREYRRYVTDAITQRSEVLFNDIEVVREHERFFEEAMNRVR